MLIFFFSAWSTVMKTLSFKTHRSNKLHDQSYRTAGIHWVPERWLKPCPLVDYLVWPTVKSLCCSWCAVMFNLTRWKYREFCTLSVYRVVLFNTTHWILAASRAPNRISEAFLYGCIVLACTFFPPKSCEFNQLSRASV